MLQPGVILAGKYRVDRVLGEGGMAVVYAVTHLRNTARLAVKVLHADSLLKGNVRARFVREGKVANSVNHPGAVQMIDDGVAGDGSPYLVMEYLNGVSVNDIGARGVPLFAALNIAYQVLDVLRAAHENGIIHRDIKPANLFVLRDGRVKVLDFGISRLHDGAEPFDSVATGSVMGTPYFMAPEQARADASEIETRTDLFAVGATLFTLISGQYLHTGDEPRQVVYRAATQQARSLASVAPGTPQVVIDLVAKAVAFASAARWESAQAMQEAVRQVHESLFGPIGMSALASLLLDREFRRKSHAKLTGRPSPGPRASAGAAPSPLSTTLPAVADVTRSRESFGTPRDSLPAPEAPNSRISAEPAELAGWTGHVPANAQQKAGDAAQARSRFKRSLTNGRLFRLGVGAAAIFVALLVSTHIQTPPLAAGAKPLPSPERVPTTPFQLAAVTAAVAATPNDGVPNVAAPNTPPPPVPGAASNSVALKGAPSLRPVSSPTTKPPPPEAKASVERLQVSPVLIQPLHPVMP